MRSKEFKKVKPFILNYCISLVIYALICLYIIWTKFHFALLDIFFFITSIYYVYMIFKLIEIIKELKNNNIIEENVYISFIKENKFDFWILNSYITLNCNRVKYKKYSNEKLYLKSSKEIDIKPQSYVKISYLKNSKIVYRIDYNSQTT